VQASFGQSRRAPQRLGRSESGGGARMIVAAIADRDMRQPWARLAGFLYLFTNLTATLAFAARSGLMAGDNAARTAAIAGSETLFRLGIATELVTVACVIALVV